MNGDRNALARSAFNAGMGARRAAGIVGPDGKELNKGQPFKVAIVGPDGKELNKGQPFKVAIVVVTQGAMVHADHSLSFGALCFNPGAMVALVGHKIEPGEGCLSMGYNNAIEGARPMQVDYYLFLSPDIVVPHTALRQLLAHQVDVIGAVPMATTQEPQMVVHPLDDKPLVAGVPVAEVAAMPPACLLVKASVFDAMKRPYFRTRMIEEDVEHGVMPAIIPEWVGFCEQVRAAGFKIWMDANLTMEIERAGMARYRMPPAPTEAEQVAAAEVERASATAQ